MSATGRSGRGDAGTTLIEALVVVAITSLVTMIGFPRLQQSLLTLSEHQTTATVAARLREARATAILNDRPIVFAVSANGHLYGWRNAAAATGPGVYLTAVGGPITFYSDGSSSGGAIWVTAGRHSNLVGVDAANAAVGLWRR
jgi:type II secretory pathway pseudopilin PulG